MRSAKGIILSGGLGTRLYPLTKALSKQTLPVYNKPMIFYPLSTLKISGVSEILIISNPEYIEVYKKLLGSGKNFGLKIKYQIQKKPKGIAQSILLSSSFIKNSNFFLILGDNLFYDKSLHNKLINICKQKSPYIFLKKVDNPKDYGVVKLEENKKLKYIKEKPKKFISNYAVTGLYYYDKEALSIAKSLKPSSRGELEITDLNNRYIQRGLMNYVHLSNKSIWLDMGSHDKLLEASNFIRAYKLKHNIDIGNIEKDINNKLSKKKKKSFKKITKK